MTQLLSHVQWLLHNKGNLLQGALEMAGENISAEQALAVMQQADPSERKLAVQWMFDTYLKGGYRWEDVEAGQESKVSATLKSFAQHRAILRGAQRNLQNYNNLAEVYLAAEAVRDKKEEEVTPSSRSIKRAEREVALNESRVLLKREDMIIAVPQTQKAAEWWGKGTQWCTAATESENYFHSYHKESPLIVIVIPDGLSNSSEETVNRKFQLWASSTEIQFMNEADAEVEIDFVRQNWSYFKEIMEWVININPSAIEYFPADEIPNLEEQLIVRAIEHNSIECEDIPCSLWNNNLAIAAVKNKVSNLGLIGDSIIFDQTLCQQLFEINFGSILYFPQEMIEHSMLAKVLEDTSSYYQFQSFLGAQHKLGLITEDMLWNAIKTNGEVFNKAPIDIFNASMIVYAIKNYGLPLSSIPESLRSDSIKIAATEEDPDGLSVLGEHEWTDEMVNTLLLSNGAGYYIHMVPDRFKSTQFYLRCVKINPLSMNHRVPENYKTPEFYTLAVKANSNLLKYIPESSVTEEMIDWVIANEPDYIEYIPVKFQTQALCERAWQANKLSITSMKYEFTTKRMWQEFFKEKPDSIYLVPTQYLDRDMCIQAVRTSPSCFEDIPYEWIDGEICSIAAQGGVNIERIPPGLITRDIVEAAIRSNTDNIRWDNFKFDKELCKIAFESNPNVISYIPKHNLDSEMLERALQVNPDNIKHARSDLVSWKRVKEIILANPESIYHLPDEFCEPSLVFPLVEENNELINYLYGKARRLWWNEKQRIEREEKLSGNVTTDWNPDILNNLETKLANLSMKSPAILPSNTIQP